MALFRVSPLLTNMGLAVEYVLFRVVESCIHRVGYLYHSGAICPTNPLH